MIDFSGDHKNTTTAQLTSHGFYTRRFVEANTPGEAELEAVNSIRKRKDIKPMLRNALDAPPMLFAEEIEEIETFEGIENLEQGIAWYEEDDGLCPIVFPRKAVPFVPFVRWTLHDRGAL